MTSLLSPFQFRSSNVPTINSNINTKLVNPDGSHYPGGFGSNVVPCKNGVQLTKLQSGGRSRKIHRKIKNIVNKYKKMRGGKRFTLRGLKKRFTKMFKRGGKKTTNKRTMARNRTVRKSRKSRKQRGGYHMVQIYQTLLVILLVGLH